MPRQGRSVSLWIHSVTIQDMAAAAVAMWVTREG